MITIELTKKDADMLEKAVRYMISNLQYERHQALMHNCSVGSYDKEIEEYRQLKKDLFNENISSRPTSD